jgi:hypothetical protein
VNVVIDYCCNAPSHQTSHDEPTLTLIRGHLAYCPTGSLIEHDWELTGGVALRELLAQVLSTRQLSQAELTYSR